MQRTNINNFEPTRRSITLAINENDQWSAFAVTETGEVFSAPAGDGLSHRGGPPRELLPILALPSTEPVTVEHDDALIERLRSWRDSTRGGVVLDPDDPTACRVLADALTVASAVDVDPETVRLALRLLAGRWTS